MTEITKKEIENFKQKYKKNYNREISDEMAYNLLDGANRLADIFCEQIINDLERKEKTK